MQCLVLAAPIDGWLVPLGEVPDPAFAGGMVGNGVAIDPVGSVLHAPCDGEVLTIAKARHAVTLRADNGAEILLHLGIDTVEARGAGLTARVEAGQRVSQGDALIDVDLDALLRHAKSLVTPAVVVNASEFAVSACHDGGRVRRGEPLLEVRRATPAGRAPEAPEGKADASGEVPVAWPHGLHARPAARLVQLSRGFPARVTLSLKGRRADARSMVGLMALGAAHGERVRIDAAGPDAARAVEAVAALLATPVGESAGDADGARDRQEAAVRPVGAGAPAGAAGIPARIASRGMAVGSAQFLPRPDFEVAEAGEGIERERQRLQRAIRDAVLRLDRLQSAAGTDILAAQAELLEDPALAADAEASIVRGKSAGFAWREAVHRARAALETSGDPRIAERVADLRDIEEQVLSAFAGSAAAPAPELAADAIILADDLLPSQLSRLEPGKIRGFCCAGGGPTSHVALMAAARRIPALVGAGPGVLEIPPGTRLVLDAERGFLHVDPPPPAIAAAEAGIDARNAAAAAYLRDAGREASTADGARIEVFANLGSAAEAREAVERGAEGCGLLRTELLYLDRDTAPTREEQTAVYQSIADALDGRPLTIRTLDVGGDKPLAYLPLPAEANPLLGLRGLRASLRFPGLLEDQLAAILAVEPPSRCRILLPMITEAAEVRTVREMVSRLLRSRRPEASIDVGAMIETPASAALADSIAREADFLSIGSNDLAQYTLAVDRAHPALAASFDHFHPAVLRQIAAVCSAAEREHCGVSVCGGLASEPLAVPVLIGLGVGTLSAVPAIVPELKALIRKVARSDCRALADRVLAEESAAGARREACAFLRTVHRT